VITLLAKARALTTTDARQAAQVAAQAAALARASGRTAEAIDAELVQGQMLATMQGDVAGGLAILKGALACADEQGDRRRASEAESYIGFVYDYLGDYRPALEHQLRALQLAEQVGDALLMSVALRTIGVTASKSGDAELGLRYYERSLALSESCGDLAGAAKVLNNIGINLKNLGRLAESRRVLERALEIADALRGGLILGGLLNNYAETLIRLGDLAAATDAVEKALTESRAVGYVRGEVNALKTLSRLLLLKGSAHAARQRGEAALARSNQTQERSAVAECLEVLVDCCKTLGDHAAALEHAEARYAIQKEIHDSEVTRRLKALETLHDLERTRREADLLRAQKDELARAYRELSAMHDALRIADEEKSRLMAELERRSNEDALTGLFNRRYLDQRLQEELLRARRQRRALCVAMADIDHFKKINDTWSHAAGDLTLRRVAALLRSTVRAFDLVARYGGEEFVVVLTDTDLDTARTICEKLRAGVASLTWPELAEGHVVTLSVGLAQDTGDVAYDRLLALADHALYRAKAAGRDCVVG
jgi:diguanylate cyclase (GGDEF)-like protein